MQWTWVLSWRLLDASDVPWRAALAEDAQRARAHSHLAQAANVPCAGGAQVLPCSKRFCHDWTVCPFAHPGEKARRRDPRLFTYTGIACPDMKKVHTLPAPLWRPKGRGCLGR